MAVPTLNEMKARDDHEIETDALSAQEIADWTRFDTCNGFAFNYLEEYEDNDVVVKEAFIEGAGIAHCFVYDKTRDVTFDATLMQFNAGPAIGVWDGENHPYQQPGVEVREWADRSNFNEFHSNETHSDFIC